MEMNHETFAINPTSEGFDREAFKKEILSNLKVLYRKTLDTAAKQEVFQAVSLAVKDLIVDRWIATQKAYQKKRPEICLLSFDGIPHGQSPGK